MPLNSPEAARAFQRVFEHGYHVVLGPYPDDTAVDHHSRRVTLTLRRGTEFVLFALLAALRDIEAEAGAKVLDFAAARQRRMTR